MIKKNKKLGVIKFTPLHFNVDEKFTGSFVHDNENLALKSITLPLNLKIKKKNNSITLFKND